MSEFTGFSTAVSAGVAVAAEMFLRPVRGIFPVGQSSSLIPQTTIEEKHHDSLMITSHPVEVGSNISDHSFMQPFELSVKYGWSVSPTIGFSVSINTDINSIYEQLRDWMTTSTPLTVLTGKRPYTNMLIQGFSVETSKETANALIAEIQFKQVIIAYATTVSGAPASSQSNPSDTAKPVNRGSVPAKQS
jgi:hypothetical protein